MEPKMHRKNKKVLAIVLFFFLSCNEYFSVTGVSGQNITEIHFQLFTRKNPNSPQILELNDLTQLLQSNYNNSLPTKMFAHGLNGSPFAGYPSKDGYLQREDCNFISVDWSVMAASGDYNYVGTYYVPLAGNLTGQYINFLVAQGAPLTAFHLIGHSFGSHVMGYAGAGVTTGRVARITGLDPSHTDEFFPLDDPDMRLDITDAQFLDVIHTEGRFTVGIGHVDFFPNGGIQQPGCDLVDPGCCNHCRAVDYFEESITTEVEFRSVSCDSWEAYQNGICNYSDTQVMGEYVSLSARGVYYLTTNAASPFAMG